jgi:hypothetical protein
MKIPNYIRGIAIKESGHFSDFTLAWLDQFIQAVQGYLSEEGIHIPSLSTVDINSLTNAPNGTLIVDATTNELKIKLNGSFKVVQVV